MDYDGEEGCEGRLRRLRAGDNSEVVIVDIEKMMTTIRAGGNEGSLAFFKIARRRRSPTS